MVREHRPRVGLLRLQVCHPGKLGLIFDCGCLATLTTCKDSRSKLPILHYRMLGMIGMISTY